MFATDDYSDDDPSALSGGLPAPDEGPVDLWAGAACRSEDGAMGALFFSDQIPEILRARDICRSCPLQEPCLQGAVARREPWGVWGGELFANGRILAQKRKRGRPPKHPRPDEVWLTA